MKRYRIRSALRVIGDILALARQCRRIDAVCILKIVRLRPGAFRILCGNDEVTSMGYVSADNIEKPVKESYGRSKKSLGMICTFQRKLGIPVQDIPDLLPVHQVLTVHQRKSRKICEG